MYKLLDHTADVKFKAKAETLEEAIEESVRAFSDIVYGKEIKEKNILEKKEIKSIEIESENLEALIFDILDRLIFLQDSEKVLVLGLDRINLKKDNIYQVSIDVSVVPIKPEMSLLDIKGPTYNEMKVEDRNGDWIIEAVLDI